MDMTEYFNLTYPFSEGVLADNKKSRGEREQIRCLVAPEHFDRNRRISRLYLEVKHNRRDELVIWGADFAVHDRILEGFEKEGFTGYRVKPAMVRFRDGSTSSEYHEFIVTGWAGAATPDSGLHLIKSCPGCHYKEYSAITDYGKIIDWNQWTGDDFFVVYPLEWYKLCTGRVAHWLRANRVKSLRLEVGFAERERDPLISRLGLTGGRLSDYLPEDLAVKYGRPLGLE